MTKAGDKCVIPPSTTGMVPEGADRDAGQAEVSGPAKVPQCGGGESGGAQVGAPRPSRG